MERKTNKKMNKEEFKLEKEIVELKHKFRMEEVESERKAKIQTINLMHEKEMERNRIKSAEIRKTQLRKGEGGFKY